jgi:hypothetical protein
MRITSLSLVKDGSEITDFSKFKENEIETTQTVEHFNGEDFVKVPKKYGFSITYLPQSGADIDWVAEEDKNDKGWTVIVNYVGGSKVTFTGVHLLKSTPNEVDGKTAKESQLEFYAAKRKVS